MINASTGARLLPAALLVLGVGSCGTPRTAATSADAIIDGDTMAVRVDQLAGPEQAATTLTRLPVVVVYGDGRVFTEKVTRARSALPTILQRRISAGSVRALVDRAIRAGVGVRADFGTPTAADAAVTRFTVTTRAGVRTMQVVALSDSGSAGFTPAQQDARQAARELLAALTDLPATLGAGAVGPATTYVPTAVVAVASPWNGYCPSPPAGVRLPSLCGQSPTGGKAQPWPGPALPGRPISSGMPVPCVTVTSRSAAAVVSAARTAATTTPWSSGGSVWWVSLRPLLPGESGCANLSMTSGSAPAAARTTRDVRGPMPPAS